MFSGRVDIEVDSQESRDYFLAHVKYLEVIDAKLTRNGNNIDLIEAMEYEPHEFYVMRTRDIVPAGKYVMHFGKQKIAFYVVFLIGHITTFRAFHLNRI